MVVLEIKQAITRSKGKQSEWEVQEVVQKSTKEWVEEANKTNISRTSQDNEISNKEQLVAQSEPLSMVEQEET